MGQDQWKMDHIIRKTAHRQDTAYNIVHIRQEWDILFCTGHFTSKEEGYLAFDLDDIRLLFDETDNHMRSH